MCAKTRLKDDKEEKKILTRTHAYTWQACKPIEIQTCMSTDINGVCVMFLSTSGY